MNDIYLKQIQYKERSKRTTNRYKREANVLLLLCYNLSFSRIEETHENNKKKNLRLIFLHSKGLLFF